MELAGEECWSVDDDTRLERTDFEVAKSLLVEFEKAYQLGNYKAER